MFLTVRAEAELRLQPLIPLQLAPLHGALVLTAKGRPVARRHDVLASPGPPATAVIAAEVALVACSSPGRAGDGSSGSIGTAARRRAVDVLAAVPADLAGPGAVLAAVGRAVVASRGLAGRAALGPAQGGQAQLFGVRRAESAAWVDLEVAVVLFAFVCCRT